MGRSQVTVTNSNGGISNISLSAEGTKVLLSILESGHDYRTLLGEFGYPEAAVAEATEVTGAVHDAFRCP